MKFLYNPPRILKLIFDQFIWESKLDKVLLTVDDGPNPKSLDIILKILQTHNLKALFFCVGNNISKYPTAVKEILDEGHTIGNHTYNHAKINFRKQSIIRSEISQTSNIMTELFDYKIKYFRPPHGFFDFNTSKILKKEKLQNVMWSLLTNDFRNDLRLVKSVIDKYLEKNSIVTFHDSNKSLNIIEDSFNYIVDKVEERKYEFGSVEECLNIHL